MLTSHVRFLTRTCLLFFPIQKSHYQYKTGLDNLRELWPLLRSATRPQIHKLSDHIHTIVLPEELNLRWPFGAEVRNLLFVRPSQQPTLDVIMDKFKEELVTGRRKYDHHGFIVKGTRGIGKSHMQPCGRVCPSMPVRLPCSY